MRMIKTILAAAMLFVCGMTAQAQEKCSGNDECCKEAQALGYKPYPYGFVQLQGGVNTVFTDVKFTDLINPTASVGFGYWFGSGVGARLHFNAWEAKGGFDKWLNGSNALETYKYNYATGNFDVLLNLTNLFSKKHNHVFNLILVGGVGLNYAWNNDEFHNLLAVATPANNTSNAWGEGTTREHLLNHNLRAGLLMDLNVAKHWNIGLEVDANSLDDRFNSKYNDADDWMVTAQLSLTYKFGFKKPCAPKPAPAPVPVVVEEPKPAPVVVEEPKPAPVPEPVKVVEEPYRDVLFYVIRGSEIDPDAIITAAANWCKKYPNKTLTVSGYADKGTGNAKLNKMYSEQRANKVVEALKAKGVPASQIKSAAYGDTVQPFEENDKNRCVILEGKL